MKPAAPDLRPDLLRGAQQLGIGLPPGAADALLGYLAELEKWNAAYNLTAIRDPAEMLVKHLLDSLAVLPYVEGRVLDAGSGAGLPAIPLAIVAPALSVTALDSNGKKARFMRHAVRALKLSNVEVVEARVEDHQAPGYDRVVSRAFASLADFFEKTAHLLAPGGQWVAMKGKLDGPELAAVPGHYKIRETHRLHVPGLVQDERHVVIAVAT